MPEDQATKTEVEIFGSVYTVRAGHDPEHLQELAAKVDRDMREIASRISTVDTAKIAILAALNIADELFESQRRREGPKREITERMIRLSETLDEVLGEGG